MSKPLRILSVVGARPNFMKIAPFARAIDAHNASEPERLIEHFLLHTGQHYDAAMSASFFDALGIPEPDIDLGIGSGTHAEQVGKTMMAFESVVHDRRPDWIIVVGDVNATCACSITAKKEHVQLAHIEAGLRSFDLDMPEEINRMVCDRLSDRLYVTDSLAAANLRAEGVPEDKIRLVGNVMIDTLDANSDKASALDISEIVQRNTITDRELPTSDLRLPSIARRAKEGSPISGHERYALMTLHRPSNVDHP
ncbi:MAG: UDP-N-acetylglucosamine 2-epimerase, partial [Kiritimatiellia bacterium]|nr:UDP-N-acetylglucosamine 2-epimerase [Kiritimatiellia bacterium]